VTVDFGERVPEIEAQLRSLFETAYLCNIFPKGLIGEFKDFFKEGDQKNNEEPAPVFAKPEPPQPESELVEKVLSGEMSISKAREIYHAEEPEPPPPPPPPPPPAPAPESHRMSVRTAEYLIETRRQIARLRNREHDDATH
jgi:hypothetical protein